MELPPNGTPRDDLIGDIKNALQGDADWKNGRIFSLVYYPGEDVAEVLKEAYTLAFYTNGLGPAAFRSLKRFESEIIAMTAGLLGFPEACGNVTSGGTESIMMAVKTARDFARAERGVTEPEMVLPVTAHPAFDKSAQYLGVKLVQFGLRQDLRADVEQARAAITPNTVLLVGSAPNYPFGTVDPIEDLGALAQEHRVPLHVDACLGGFMWPFMERNGEPVPAWDFRVPGVTSISADLHKYGYSARGSSTIMYRDRSYRKHQFFTKSDWPGGLYGSPTMTGSKPGAAVVASWAVLNYLGSDGYQRLAKTTMDTARKLQAGINAIPALQVLGAPPMSLFAFGSDTVDVYAVSEAMNQRGWFPDRQQLPPSLHMMITPAHAPVADQLLEDLRGAVEDVESGEVKATGEAALYGAVGNMPDKGPVKNLIADFIDGLTVVSK
jgi:glutamate/tyrosine decarboxylase-like PLP-dependent enzyme